MFAIYFEMGKSWLADLGVTSADQLYDARTNIPAAYHLYTLAGWEPWSQTDPGADDARRPASGSVRETLP